MAHFCQQYQLFSNQPNNNNNHINAAPSSQFYQPDNNNIICVHQSGTTCPPQGTKVINNYATSISTKISSCPNSSTNSNKKVETTVVKQLSQLVHSPIHNKKRKNKEGSSSIISLSTMNMEEMQAKKHKKDKKRNEETPSEYIHVRARRGQATDSHSLAERMRREKISERMKTLQALVPGCDKVNGKALMLDEIINYVQSLQHQVEFLSVKLATVNPMYYDFGLDLDTLMVTTEQMLTTLTSPQSLPPQPPPPPNMHPYNVTQQISAPNHSTNPLATSSIFCLPDNSSSSSLPIHQDFMPNISLRGSGQHFLDLDDQIMHKLVNQQLSEFNSY